MMSRERIVCLFIPSLGKFILGYLDFWIFYRIVYFGVVFDLVIQICISYRTYIFSNCNHSLIGPMYIIKGGHDVSRTELTCMLTWVSKNGFPKISTEMPSSHII